MIDNIILMIESKISEIEKCKTSASFAEMLGCDSEITALKEVIASIKEYQSSFKPCEFCERVKKWGLMLPINTEGEIVPENFCPNCGNKL